MQEWDLALAQAQEVIKANPALFDVREAGESCDLHGISLGVLDCR